MTMLLTLIKTSEVKFEQFVKLSGMQGLAESLKTNYEKGLNPIDFEEREAQFGTNRKPPPKKVSFCKLMLGALDDFMLKLLLVCACVSIAIDVGFADPQERSHGNIKYVLRFYSLD